MAYRALPLAALLPLMSIVLVPVLTYRGTQSIATAAVTTTPALVSSSSGWLRSSWRSIQPATSDSLQSVH